MENRIRVQRRTTAFGGRLLLLLCTVLLGMGALSTANGTASAAVSATAGPATHFLVLGPSTATAGSPVNFTVTAEDATNQIATTYTGVVHITSSDLSAALPGNYAFQPSDNGQHSFTATLNTAGPQSIAATDTVNSTITGISNSISVATIGGSSGTLQLSTTSAAAGQAVTGTVCNFAAGLLSLQVALSASGFTTQTYNVSATAGNPGCYTVTIPTSALSGGTYTVTVSNGSTSTASAVLTISGIGSGTGATLQVIPSTISAGQAVSGTACGFAALLSSMAVTISNGSYTVATYSEPVSASSVGTGCYTVPIPTSGLTTGTYSVTVNGNGTTAAAQLYVNITGTGASGTLTFNVSTAVPGTLVSANGCGFTTGESLSLLISNSPTKTGAVAVALLAAPTLTGTGANNSSCYSVQFSMPSGLSAGILYLFLTGASSGNVDSGQLNGTTSTTATLSAAPTTVAPGGAVSLTGSGFAANATVTISAFGTTQTVVSTAGTISATLTVPAGTAAGGYSITALDSTGISANTTITVGAASGALQVGSSSGTPGQAVTVSGSGFTAGELVSISLSNLTTPPAAIAGTAEQFTVGTGGTISVQYTVPSVAAGTYYLLAQGGTSGASATAVFYVAAAPAATATPVPPVATPIPPPATATALTALPSVSSSATTRYFAAGYTGSLAGNGKVAFVERLSFFNPGSVSSTVTTTYAVYNPATKAYSRITETDTVAPGATISRSVNSDVGSDRMVSATVSAPSGIVAEELITRTGTGGAVLNSASSMGSAALGTSWYLAEGYTGISFQEYLTIYNPGASAAHVQVYYLPSDTAAPQAQTQTVPAGGQATINVRSQYNGLEPHGSKNIAVQVTSDQPVAVDREMYWGAGSGSAKYGASLAPAVASGASTQYFALLPTSGGSQSFITVLNPGSSAANLTLTLVNATGSIVKTVSASVGAQRRYTFMIPSLVPGNNGNLAATLSAGTPVVAEASVYLGGSPNIGAHPGTAEQGSTGIQIGAQAYLDGSGGTMQVYNPGTTATRVQVLVGGSVVSDTTVPASAAGAVSLSGSTSPQGVLVLAGGMVSAALLNGNSNTAPTWGGSLG